VYLLAVEDTLLSIYQPIFFLKNSFPIFSTILCLQADLARVDRSRTPWLIAVLHAPWYNSNAAHQLNGDRMMAAMESLLYEARVDLVFAGHVHAYERMVIISIVL
jgi:hypothetical protein